MSNLANAITLAATKHQNQKDKSGKPYILHLIRVMMRLRTKDEELMTMAVMHDLREDTDVTREDLVSMGYSKRVVDALDLLTHVVDPTIADPDEEYACYIRKIGQSKDATLIKLEDLRDNSDITRLKGVTPKDHKRMAKYNRSYLYLEGVLVAAEKAGF